MNRSQLIQQVSNKHNLPEKQVAALLDSITDEITTRLASGESVVIKNFGRFEPRERQPSTKRNPKSGEEIKVGRRTAVLFHAAPALKEKLNAERKTD